MKQSQRGIGLMEVLVALFILAIAVLGFVALQMRAVTASVEAGNNVHATNIARDLAERIRANQREGFRAFQQAAGTSSGKFASRVTKCSTDVCTPAEFASYDFGIVNQRAEEADMRVALRQCQGNGNLRRLCVYVAWGNTNPTNGAGENDCTNGTKYQTNAQCIIMETYNYD